MDQTPPALVAAEAVPALVPVRVVEVFVEPSLVEPPLYLLAAIAAHNRVEAFDLAELLMAEQIAKVPMLAELLLHLSLDHMEKVLVAAILATRSLA